MELNGEPWFVAADVCKVLAHKNPTVAVRILDDAEKAKSDLGSGRDVNIVSESGLYKLIMRSDKAEAKAFQGWVTKVVLPAYRKDGGYILGDEEVASLENLGTPVEHDTNNEPRVLDTASRRDSVLKNEPTSES